MRPAGCNTFDVNRCPLWYFRASSVDPRSFFGSLSLPICLCSFCYSAAGFQSGIHLETGRNARRFSNSQVPRTTAMYVSSRSPIRGMFHHFGTHLALICGHLGTFGHHFGILGVPLGDFGWTLGTIFGTGMSPGMTLGTTRKPKVAQRPGRRSQTPF